MHEVVHLDSFTHSRPDQPPQIPTNIEDYVDVQLSCDFAYECTEPRANRHSMCNMHLTRLMALMDGGELMTVVLSLTSIVPRQILTSGQSLIHPACGGSRRHRLILHSPSHRICVQAHICRFDCRGEVLTCHQICGAANERNGHVVARAYLGTPVCENGCSVRSAARKSGAQSDACTSSTTA
jgi:hypothetical protein